MRSTPTVLLHFTNLLERNRRVIASRDKQASLNQAIRDGFDVDAEDSNYNKNALAGMHKEDKIKREEIKSNRVKANDPTKGDFMGPWAGQRDEKFLNVELNEE